MRERWRERLRADGHVRIRRSRTPALVVLGLSGLLLAAGGWLLGVDPGPIPGWLVRAAGAVVALFGLLGTVTFGFRSLRPGTVVTIDETGVTPAGQPRIAWSELRGVEIREEQGGVLVLRTVEGFTERTAPDLGRLARFARNADVSTFGPDRVRLRTATPAEAEDLADLLRWARKQVRRGGLREDTDVDAGGGDPT